MARYRLRFTRKSLLYTGKTLLGTAICWAVLRALGIDTFFWAAITVILVSDPDLSTTRDLVNVRVINTIVGCSIGLISLLLFGYAPEVAILTAAATVLFATSVEHYPANWRLAPVTVLILMDSGRLATSHAQEIHFALLRAGEIGLGSAVALLLATLTTRYFIRAEQRRIEGGE